MRRKKKWEADERFDQLLALAREGGEDAVGDLYREYGFEYGRDEVATEELMQATLVPPEDRRTEALGVQRDETPIDAAIKIGHKTKLPCRGLLFTAILSMLLLTGCVDGSATLRGTVRMGSVNADLDLLFKPVGAPME